MAVRRRLHAFAFSCLIALAAVSMIAAFTASNSVPSSRADDQSQPISTDQLKPPECRSLTLTNRISGAGVIVGTTGNDLIFGSSGPDTIDGLAGNDCIVGLGGDDVITGGPGIEVCLGGPGTDTFIACETAIQ
jgi:hypothetical protein